VRRDGDAGVIEAVQPRANLLYRSDAFKTKAIAANVTQLAVVVAARPSFSLELVQRCILAAEDQDIASLLVLNKTDLPETPEARQRLQGLARIGYTTLLIGQSGMGKSTLINALVPHAAAATAEYSEALDSGRHTTTHTRLHRLDASSAVIDSPGLQEFALQHLDAAALAHAFVEFRPFLGQCRFRDCRHEHEPGCRLQQAVEEGAVEAARLQLFQTLRRTQHQAAQPR